MVLALLGVELSLKEILQAIAPLKKEVLGAAITQRCLALVHPDEKGYIPKVGKCSAKHIYAGSKAVYSIRNLTLECCDR